MPSIRLLCLAGLAAGFCFSAQAASAADGHFELGLRANIVGADGEPSNDQLGAGMLARYQLNDRWRLGVVVDQASGFDVEVPADQVGIATAADSEAIDATADSTHLTVWIERVYPRPSGRLEWFWGAGLGAGQVDVETTTGPRAGGGTYTIEQEVGTEVLLTGLAGLRIKLGQRWALETALRLDQHFTDWKIRDTVSGRTGSYDDYLVRGIHLAVVVRF